MLINRSTKGELSSGDNAEEVLAACPYNIPRIEPETGLLKKCDMCVGRVKAGLEPVCAKTCASAAINFGDEKTIMKLAHKRLAETKQKFGNRARLLNADKVSAIYLVTADPDKYYEFATF